MLIGSYNYQLDQKNRFRIPSKLKASLGDNLVLTKGVSGCIELFNADKLEYDVVDKMKDISLFDSEAQKSLRLLLSNTFELELDNQGRALLPAVLKSFAKINKNIVFIGVGRRVEIWAEEEWNNYNEACDFDTEIQKLSKHGV